MGPLRILGALGLYLGACELADYFLVRRPGEEVFRPKLGWRLLRWVILGSCVSGIVVWAREKPRSLSDSSLWFYAVVFLVWLFWPRTIFVDSAGVGSCGFFGSRRRSIIWPDVSRISSDWQEEGIRFWTLMGTSIAVTSRYGACIEHGLVNRKQAAFLAALRRHLPREVFDPGLYDWNPIS